LGTDYLGFLIDVYYYYHPKGFHEDGARIEINNPAAMAKPKNKAWAHT